jgi:hypothetical protein
MNKSDTLNQILNRIANGDYSVTIKFPDFRPIKAKIDEISFKNIAWKPIHVVFEDDNLTKEESYFIDAPFSDDGAQVMEYRTVKYKEDWIKLDYVILNPKEGK